MLPSKCDWITFSIHQYEPYGGRIFLLGNVYSVEMFLSRIPIDLYGGYDAIVTSVGMDKRKLRLRRRAASFRLRIMRATAGDLGSGGLKLPRLLVFFSSL